MAEAGVADGAIPVVGGSGGPAQVLDTRLGKIGTFNGSDKDWPEWSFQAKAYMALMSPTMLTHMEGAEQQANIIPLDELAAQAKTDGRTLFYVLVFACKGSAGLLLRRCPPGHGLEAWRQLCNRYGTGTSNSAMHLLQAVLGFSFGTSVDHLEERLY